RTSRSDHWICAERSAHCSSRFRASLRKTERSANSELMSHAAHHDPAILQGARRVRYLKLIALFKIFKGVLLLLLSVSLLFVIALILLANCFIVWFLYRVLKRDKTEAHVEQPRELVETV